MILCIRPVHLVSIVVVSSFCASMPAAAQDAKPDDAQAARFATFEKTMSNVKLVGQFTITGRDGAPKKEEYQIKSVSKLPEGDYWSFHARIKYGDYDLTVPLRLEVKWAGDTPVITLDKLTIPALGTFGARVVIHDGKYAGTWSHGDVGGHLFGVIESVEPDEKPQDK